ncbi:alpha-2,8-polysialyltransferase family protein [Ensifer sp. LCM 4579]|uniref:alpha-2,8-polysialyltransferase family protein n=1 Tax=Ensifer sp. LCM 4579 TaxID=1848292 RepID=UPI0008DA8BC6|nr:alpha-2,8-polysialyltransferase family protein [Ensifer sp. LCM 4579]OHV85964.1 hypothetical protein LCM4579_00960 [Ensifer sp. LCM 4579]
MDTYLVVVSQVGQLKHAEALLRSLNVEGATAAILYTARNKRMPEIIASAVNRDFFRQSVLVEIHTEANQLHLGAVRFNRAAYRRLLDELSPTHLFVCSYERHYALLCQEARARDISVNLFEEGAGSFKGLIEDYESFPKPSFTSAIYRVYRRVWKDTAIVKRLIAPLYAIGRDIVLLPKLLFDTVREAYYLPFFQENRLTREEPVYVNGWKDFDAVYSSSPDLMGKVFKANSFVEASPSFDDPEHIELARKIIAGYRIDGNTAIFTSQLYSVDPQTSAESVVSCLRRLIERTGWRVLIKLHPKEAFEVAAHYEKAAMFIPGIEVIKEPDTPPAEYLAIYSQCPSIVGITSSTLIYAPKRRSDLRAITIGTELLNEFASRGVSSAGTRLIEQHVKILPVIPYIEDSGGVETSTPSDVTRTTFCPAAALIS